ncbi:MAG: Eco57I restriction-modification methylase domain-containing protein [Deltaproteobacteria bacterium]|nr:Eco57I restriction-modification methylase domain-containing protein [Deltaproteobacteria bacterium]
MTDLKTRIQNALKTIPDRPFIEAAGNLLNILGYKSDKTFLLTPNNYMGFADYFIQTPGVFDTVRARTAEWQSVDILFQLTEDELKTQHTLFEIREVDNRIIESYLFFAIALAGDSYARGELARITREINKLTPMPAMVLFAYNSRLTIAVIDRRLNRKERSRDVLEKVTLIKDIDCTRPHRAHIEILHDLALDQLGQRHGFTNFIELHRAWQKTLDITELNRRFFKEIADWYFWAIRNTTFPKDAGKERETRQAVSVIRLITRLIFVWFIKEKGLIPDDLFDRRKLGGLLNFEDPQGSAYYKAILQNLFFATLNQEMNTAKNPDRRKFRSRAKEPGRRDSHYMIHNVYRYENAFTNPKEALQRFSSIPFLNGGLFECLDRPDKKDPQKILRIDGFSDHPYNELAVPDYLFFSPKIDVDLNGDYGTKNKRYTVQGLIPIFEKYKFTIDENTPVEEEIALDPELLGRVFENLLAAYNPETGATARKQTGSFYTPREIVNYMVDEALKAHLMAKLIPEGPADPKETSETDAKLEQLFAYTEEPHRFTETESARFIEAIDHVKILDPACGSGAFPMGVLHRLVFLLAKLDPHNRRWKEKQLAKAAAIDDGEIRDRTIADIEEAFDLNELDYGRKLYLIENCIYGVDIQPIAVQIAKLRFFISLIVDQKIDDARENRGIRPLPNLETKFVAANTLLMIERPKLSQGLLRDWSIDEKERELSGIRRKHFTARTPATKARCREQDARVRAEIADLLKKERMLPREEAKRLARWDPYDQNASADFFDPEWMFGVTEGFDITLGNPPYVRADSGEEHLKLRKAVEQSGCYRTLWEKWDLYVPFIERGFQLLKPEGFTTMIVSDAFCHSKYALKPQEWYLKNACVRRLDFFSRIKIFDAAVRNITYLFRKADGAANRPERRLHDPSFGMVTLLPTDEQANLTYRAFFPEDETNNFFSGSTLTLAEICYITKGMVVHADERVAQGAFQMDDLVADARDDLHPKPFVEGKHLGRWLPADRKWLEWGTDRAPALFSRPTFPELYEVAEKIISVDMAAGAKQLRVVYDNQQLYHNHSAWSFIPWLSLAGVRNNSIKKTARYGGEKPPRPDLPRREDLEKTSRRFAVKYLLAVMNSAAARDYLRAHRRSNIHLYPDDWKKLPIPDVLPEQQAPLVSLVDQILAARRADPRADISIIEHEIDALVSGLYGIDYIGLNSERK